MRFGIMKTVTDAGDTEKRSIRTPPEPLGVEKYGEIEDQLGYAFKDRSWLERALPIGQFIPRAPRTITSGWSFWGTPFLIWLWRTSF